MPLARARQTATVEPCASCEARPFSICAAVADEDLARLAAVATPMEIEPGTAFIEEGAPADSFFVVTAGVARVFKSLPDGRRQITGFARRGCFLGLAADQAYGFSAEAIDAVRLCRFSRPRLRALMSDLPALERRLLDAAASELMIAQEQMLLLGRKTARERLASFLLALSAPPARCTPPLARLRLPMPRTDIADYLGLTIETVSRTLARLRAARLIRLAGSSDVTILDRDGLARAAEGSD
jgi:CRP/FNR family transcriptional regulator